MTAPTIAGLPLGAFTVIVGQDEEALRRALRVVSRDPHQAPFGVSDFAMRCAAAGNPLALDCLFDSLHPTRIPAAMASLRAAGVPVVATTHNVYVLDCCDLAEVIVLHDGQPARMSEHPRVEGTAFTAGQLWSLDDESTWVPAAVERRGR